MANSDELHKFSLLKDEWWQKDGALKTLHDINPTRLAFIKSFVDLADKKVLDLGCGGGILTEALADAGANCVGVDAEEQAIKVAKAHNPKIEYLASYVEDLSYQNFDIIVCMEMLEHVDEPQDIIKHCKKMLKPGGWLFLSTINRSLKAYLQAIIAAEYILNIIPKQTHQYKKFIKPSELVNMCHGFDIQGVRGMHYNPFTRQAKLTDDLAINYLLACKL